MSERICTYVSPLTGFSSMTSPANKNTRKKNCFCVSLVKIVVNENQYIWNFMYLSLYRKLFQMLTLVWMERFKQNEARTNCPFKHMSYTCTRSEWKMSCHVMSQIENTHTYKCEFIFVFSFLFNFYYIFDYIIFVFIFPFVVLVFKFVYF